MADEIIKKDGAGDEEGDGDEEDVDLVEELRAAFGEAETIKADLFRAATALEAQKQPGGAEALRQVAGNVVPLLSDLIAIVAGAFETLEERIGSVETQQSGGLDDEDAYMLVRIFEQNIRLFKKLVEVATGIERTAVEELLKLNQEAQERVVEISGDDEILESVRKEIDEALSGAN